MRYNEIEPKMYLTDTSLLVRLYQTDTQLKVIEQFVCVFVRVCLRKWRVNMKAQAI